MNHSINWLEKAPICSEIILIIALAWVSSSLLLPANTAIHSDQALQKITSGDRLPNVSNLIAVPLFGAIKSHVQPVKTLPQAPKPIVSSPLHITLLGTVVAKDHAAAIIAMVGGREQQVVFLGDSIQPGVVLKSVEAEAIMVDHDGKLERISLEQGAKLTSAPALPSNPPGMAADLFRSHTQAAPMRKQMNRHQLHQQLQNFPALLSQARVLPHIVNGKPAGFTITEIVPGSLYQQAGLQNGDIILSINGTHIHDASQAMQMYQTLKSASALDLELLRAGQLRQIHYDIR